MPISSSFPHLNLPAGSINCAAVPYPCPTHSNSSALYNMQHLMAPQGLEFGRQLVSPSSHARACFIAALARGTGQLGHDLTSLPLLSSGLQTEISSQVNHHSSASDENNYKCPPVSQSVAAPAGVASSNTFPTTTGPTAIPIDQPSYRPSACVVPQQPCVLPAAISSPACSMMVEASSSSCSSSNLSSSAPGQYNKVPDPLEELMQTLTRGKLSSSSSSSSSLGPEVNELPSMHDMHAWELTDEHARPFSLRSWDEEDSSSSSSDHVSCSPGRVSEFCFMPAG